MARNDPYQEGAKVRVFSTSITLNSQATTTTIDIGTLPADAAFKIGWLNTDTSLGTSTIQIGTASDPDKYKADATFTATDTPTAFGNQAASLNPVSADEDIILTVGTAALPSSGTLQVLVEYLLD